MDARRSNGENERFCDALWVRGLPSVSVMARAVKTLKNAADDDDPRHEPLQNELYLVAWLVFAAFWLPAVLAAVAPAAFFRFLTGSLICCSMTVLKRGRLRAFRVASALTAEDSAVVFRIQIADWTFPASLFLRLFLCSSCACLLSLRVLSLAADSDIQNLGVGRNSRAGQPAQL
jgi:hypothetical protein